MSLDELLRAAQAGKPGADTALVKALHATLHAFFRRRAPLDADDLIQATLLVIYQRMDDFEPARPDGFTAMVYATASRLLFTKRRASARELDRRVELPPIVIATGTSPSGVAARRELMDEILAALSGLASTDRRMLSGWAWGVDWRELVEREGVTRASLRSRVRRALGRLRDALRRANPALLSTAT